MTAVGSGASRPSLTMLGVTTAVASSLGVYALVHNGPAAIDTWDVLETLVGWAFVSSGLYAWWRRPANPLGKLMITAGTLWMVGRALREVDDSISFTAGLWIGDLWGVAFVWVLLAFPDGRVPLRADRLVVLLMLLTVGPLELVWLLFWDPGPPGNALLAWPHEQVASVIDTVQRLVVGLATAGLAIVLSRRWLAASRPLRRVLLPVLAGAASLLLGAVLNMLDKVGVSAPAVRWFLLVAFVAVPVAVVFGIIRARFARAGIAELVMDLRSDPAPEHLRAALARALGDPSMDISFWLPTQGGFADAEGVPVDLTGSAAGRSITVIDNKGAPIAALRHDASLDDEPELLKAVAATASIALENGQLHADLQSRLEDLRGMQLQASAAGALERKRLERDLHDGTQQRLIALSTELTLLERKIKANPDVSSRFVHAREQLATSLAELRDVARGARPGVLATRGFTEAVRSAVATCTVPATATIDVADSLPDPIADGAYYVLCESLANVSKHSQASSVHVDVVQSNGMLHLDVRDNGIGGVVFTPLSGLHGLRDRVESLGGDFAASDAPGGGTHISVTFPLRSRAVGRAVDIGSG